MGRGGAAKDEDAAILRDVPQLPDKFGELREAFHNPDYPGWRLGPKQLPNLTPSAQQWGRYPESGAQAESIVPGQELDILTQLAGLPREQERVAEDLTDLLRGHLASVVNADGEAAERAEQLRLLNHLRAVRQEQSRQGEVGQPSYSLGLLTEQILFGDRGHYMHAGIGEGDQIPKVPLRTGLIEELSASESQKITDAAALEAVEQWRAANPDREQDLGFSLDPLLQRLSGRGVDGLPVHGTDWKRDRVAELALGSAQELTVESLQPLQAQAAAEQGQDVVQQRINALQSLAQASSSELIDCQQVHKDLQDVDIAIGSSQERVIERARGGWRQWHYRHLDADLPEQLRDPDRTRDDLLQQIQDKTGISEERVAGLLKRLALQAKSDQPTRFV